MPKSENQKFKSLLVAQVLLKRADEDHAIRTKKIIDFLEEYGISAEAHSIQRDIKMLNELFEKDTDPNILVDERERLNYYIDQSGDGSLIDALIDLSYKKKKEVPIFQYFFYFIHIIYYLSTE